MDKNYFLPFERIDALLNIELRPKDMVQGIIPKLYKVARDEEPLSYLTAKAFIDQPKAAVGIVTGVDIAGMMPNGEMDGLPGSVFLGRALGLLGHKVTILSDKGCVAPMDALLKAFNIKNVSIFDATSATDAEVLKIADEVEIGVAIEKIGANRKGLRHTIEGKCYEDKTARNYADAFFLKLNEQGKTTIGYGDGGNEIGMGKIFYRVRDIAEFAARCKCPCKDGMATVIPATICWPVNVSNFGAYGTIAAMAMLSGKRELALTPGDLLSALNICVANNVVDGGSGKLVPGEDGIPAETAAAYVQIMKTVVDMSFTKWERPF